VIVLMVIFYILFFSLGIYTSKTYILCPGINKFLFMNFYIIICNIIWLYMLSKYKELYMIGSVCNLLCLLSVIFIGIFVFNEKVTYCQSIGIILGILAILLISMGK